MIFASPFTGELLRYWWCTVHEGFGLGGADEVPHHCRAVWDSPRLQEDCCWEETDEAV